MRAGVVLGCSEESGVQGGIIAAKSGRGWRPRVKVETPRFGGGVAGCRWCASNTPPG